MQDWLIAIILNNPRCASQQELVIDSDRDIFLDVYADWCGPCVEAHTGRLRALLVEQGALQEPYCMIVLRRLVTTPPGESRSLNIGPWTRRNRISTSWRQAEMFCTTGMLLSLASIPLALVQGS